MWLSIINDDSPVGMVTKVFYTKIETSDDWGR